MTIGTSAAEYIDHLMAHQSSQEIKKIQQTLQTGSGPYGADDSFMGVRPAHVSAASKAFQDMPTAEIEKLLESPMIEVRTGAVRIMARQAAAKKTSREQRKALLVAYLKRHDRINNADLVDAGAPDVIGRYLIDQSRDLLYEMARSQDPWKRRSAIFATVYFIQQGDVKDTFKIAQQLLIDPEDQIHEAAGWMLRKAGKKDPASLGRFLDAYAARMPRAMLERAIDLCDKKTRAYYLRLKEEAAPKKQPPTSTSGGSNSRRDAPATPRTMTTGKTRRANQ